MHALTCIIGWKESLHQHIAMCIHNVLSSLIAPSLCVPIPSLVDAGGGKTHTGELKTR